MAAAASALSGGKAVPARLTICSHAKPIDCMVDGHTVWMAGTKIHITDIDTPKIHPPRCAREARLGQAATLKMHPFLNAGPFTPAPIKRDIDRYDRKLRLVERGWGVAWGGSGPPRPRASLWRRQAPALVWMGVSCRWS